MLARARGGQYISVNESIGFAVSERGWQVYEARNNLEGDSA